MKNRPIPFVTLEEHKGEPSYLAIDGASRLGNITFPANKTGCRKAGEYLYDQGVETWNCSSTCDFPKEYGCKVNVRRLIVEGHRMAAARRVQPRRIVLAKMFKLCSGMTFQACLNKQQKEVFKQLREDMLGG